MAKVSGHAGNHGLRTVRLPNLRQWLRDEVAQGKQLESNRRTGTA